jgi:hypothetical protein
MGNCTERQDNINNICIKCIQYEKEIIYLKEMIEQIETLINLKNNKIDVLEKEIYILEKYS